jgi:tripartite-type tricarboxylate transporter receptor subunit TctC
LVGWHRHRPSRISRLVAINQVLIVRNSLDVNSSAEFLELAKQKPSTISFGGYGIGSTGHLKLEMLQHDTHVNRARKCVLVAEKRFGRFRTRFIGPGS